MRSRPFQSVTPLAYQERRLGAFLVSQERYRGFFAERHTHAEWQVQVPLRGRIHVTVGDERHLAGPESVILMPPHVGHAALPLDGELELFNLMAPASWLAELAATLAAPAPVESARVVTEPFLWALAAQLAAEVRQPGLGSDRMVTLGIEQLGVAILRAYQAAPERPAPVEAGILRAIEVMLRDYGQALTVAELAAQAGITPRHFDRLFQAATGRNPKQFLTDVRLRAARELLASTQLSVTQIAHDVGFNQPSHFIRTFRRAIGLPPAAYRREVLGRAYAPGAENGAVPPAGGTGRSSTSSAGERTRVDASG